MKKIALVSALCALLFTNVVASTKDLEPLTGRCSKGDQKACRKLAAAIRELTDQALLAMVVVNSKDPAVRWAAAEKLTDQAELAKISVQADRKSTRLNSSHLGI